MSIILDGTLGITAPTGASTAEFLTSSTGFKNRIINGAMVIDQRNAGASVTPSSSQYLIDRWQCVATIQSKFSYQTQTSVVPVGFTNAMKITTVSAYAITASDFLVYQQQIEGFNVSDLGWGSVNAKAVTLSFWVQSSLTGTFSGFITNGTNARSYPFTYTISSANTWTQINLTIPGDTTGTWNTTNTSGIQVGFTLGAGSTYSGTAGAWATATYLGATGATSVVGTNGATFYITGVQIEKGSTATSFDYRPYGTELTLCYRYYYRETYTVVSNLQHMYGYGYMFGTTQLEFAYSFPVEMRAAPTFGRSDVTTFALRTGGQAVTGMTNYAPTTRSSLIYTVNAAATANTPNSLSTLTTNGSVSYLEFIAEL